MGVQWSPDSRYLAVGEVRVDRLHLDIWDRETGEWTEVTVPDGRELAVRGGALARWTRGGRALVVTLHPVGWRAEASGEFGRLTRGPIVVQSSDEPFLAWDALRARSAIVSVARYDVESARVTEIIPTTKVNGYRLTDDDSSIVFDEDITEETSYERIFGRRSSVKVVSMSGGEPKVVIESTEEVSPTWARNGRVFAYSDDGDVFVASVDDPEPRRLTGEEEPEEAGESEEEDDELGFSVNSVSPSGGRIVASNKQGLWIIESGDGDRHLILERDEDDEFAPQYRVVDWSPDGELVYLSYASRREWERGLVRYRVDSREMTELAKDDRLYSRIQLSESGSTFVFQSAAGNRPYDLYAADAEFGDVRRLTTLNPGLERKSLSRTELIRYLDVDGKTLHGVAYYPVDYEAGRAYPTIFNVYEDYFDDSFNGTINILTNGGYLVVRPSVNLEIGYPGEAWMKGVTAAANKLIEMGLADPDRLGVHGTSYGGYATNLLVTQTNRFKAAINISGKVDMISFYTDSPRLGVRNIHAPENSQDRIGATLWEQPQKYVAHSAVMFADRIETPLLLITGEQDHNVPMRTTMEMFYALRRLGKTVEWVNYVDGGHGMPTMTAEMVHDYHRRILEWYDRHLKADEEPVAAKSR
jgi:dipeptidyl aminopeptidase/acylaminoacyl peptidase